MKQELPGNYTIQVLVRDNKHSRSSMGDDLPPKSINITMKMKIDFESFIEPLEEMERERKSKVKFEIH